MSLGGKSGEEPTAEEIALTKRQLDVAEEALAAFQLWRAHFKDLATPPTGSPLIN